VAVQDVHGEVGVRLAELLDELGRVGLVDAVPELAAALVDGLDVVGGTGGLVEGAGCRHTAETWSRGQQQRRRGGGRGERSGC
jgi:hypothetical protein